MKDIKSRIVLLVVFFTLISLNIFGSIDLTMKSEAVILIDADSGQILFEKNMNKREFPASITKIMTGMLALENKDLNEVLTMTHEDVFSVERDSSHIALNVGERISLLSAMYALAIESANDAANGIATLVSGDIKNFVDLMNERAKELGAVNTHFVTTNGLDDPNHYTTAHDMALIMRQAIQTPYFTTFFSEANFDIPPTNMQTNVRHLHNKNSLLNGNRHYEGLIASKTGFTKIAKHTLVSAAKRGDRTLIVVAMNSLGQPDKYEDTMKLFDYGFNNFKNVTLNKKDILKGLKGHQNYKEIKEIINQNDPTINFLLNEKYTLNDVTVTPVYDKINNQINLAVNTKNEINTFPKLTELSLKQLHEPSKSKYSLILTYVFHFFKGVGYFLFGILCLSLTVKTVRLIININKKK